MKVYVVALSLLAVPLATQVAPVVAQAAPVPVVAAPTPVQNAIINSGAGGRLPGCASHRHPPAWSHRVHCG